MMKPPQLGDQELEALRFVTDHAPVTVRAVAQDWGEPRGLARTTILTMMERLRKKNFLTRWKSETEPGAFLYGPVQEKSVLMRGLVQDFVERTLGGSLSPFVAYLADARGLTDKEQADLSRLIASMENNGDNAAAEPTQDKEPSSRPTRCGNE